MPRLHEARAADDFLEPEKAFQFSARAARRRSRSRSTSTIAPGYYLYREQFKFAAAGASLGTPVIPPGKVKFDETFQKNVETYRDHIAIVVPVEQAGAEFKLLVTSQGCADAGLCYPPMQSAAAVGLTAFGGSGSARVEPPAEASTSRDASTAVSAPGTLATAATGAAPAAAAQDAVGIDAVLRSGAFWPIVGAFFIAGLLLSLTPCVLPMLPIVSSIIVGQGGYGRVRRSPALTAAAARRGVSRRRGFALAASYSFGMAVVYTAFGVAAGLAGEGLAAALQNPWVLGAFALGLVALSLSMFGVYELQMPSSITGRINDAAQKLPAGKVAGVVRDGRRLGAHRQPLRCRAARRCPALPEPDARRLARRHRALLPRRRHERAAAAGRRVRGCPAAARRRLDGRGQGRVRHPAARRRALDRAADPARPARPRALGRARARHGDAALHARARGARPRHAPPAATAAPATRLGWRQAIAALLGLVGVLQIVGAASGATDPLQPLARFSARSDIDASPGMPRFNAVRASTSSMPP